MYLRSKVYLDNRILFARRELTLSILPVDRRLYYVMEESFPYLTSEKSLKSSSLLYAGLETYPKLQSGMLVAQGLFEIQD